MKARSHEIKDLYDETFLNDYNYKDLILLNEDDRLPDGRIILHVASRYTMKSPDHINLGEMINADYTDMHFVGINGEKFDEQPLDDLDSPLVRFILNGSENYKESKLYVVYGNQPMPQTRITPNVEENYTILASSTGSGTITPSGNVPVPAGEDQGFEIVPSEGCSLKKLLVDNKNTDLNATSLYLFANVSGNHTINAVFSSIWTVTFAIDEGLDEIRGNTDIHLTITSTVPLYADSGGIQWKFINRMSRDPDRILSYGQFNPQPHLIAGTHPPYIYRVVIPAHAKNSIYGYTPDVHAKTILGNESLFIRVISENKVIKTHTFDYIRYSPRTILLHPGYSVTTGQGHSHGAWYVQLGKWAYLWNGKGHVYLSHSPSEAQTGQPQCGFDDGIHLSLYAVPLLSDVGYNHYILKQSIAVPGAAKEFDWGHWDYSACYHGPCDVTSSGVADQWFFCTQTKVYDIWGWHLGFGGGLYLTQIG